MLPINTPRMTKLHYKLCAPQNPLGSGYVFPPPKMGYYILDSTIVSSGVADFFKDVLGLKISMAVLFYRPAMQAMPGRLNQGIIHRDVTWNNVWQDMHYAVNWELTPGISTLSWWETTDEPVYPPVPDPVTRDDLLRGVHFKQRNNIALLHSGYTRLSSVDIGSNPVLVNTSVPHSVDYCGRNHERWGLSVRFDRDVESWSEAVEIFKKIITE